MTAIGTEIANGDWSAAFWGRGSMFAPSKQKAQNVEGVDPLMTLPIRVMTLINEAGVAIKPDGDALRFVATVRTVFANPDDVVSQLEAITAIDLLGNHATEKAKPVADAHAGTPFADDFAAGQTGLLVPTTLIGMGASIAIPAFVRYTRGNGGGDDDKPRRTCHRPRPASSPR